MSAAFGYGTPAYLRYNQAAALDPSPLITNATLRSPVLRPVGGPGRHDAKVHEASQHFSESKEQSIALLRKAISTLEDEIADAEPVVEAVQESKATPVIEAVQESKATQKAGEEKAADSAIDEAHLVEPPHGDGRSDKGELGVEENQRQFLR